MKKIPNLRIYEKIIQRKKKKFNGSIDLLSNTIPLYSYQLRKWNRTNRLNNIYMRLKETGTNHMIWEVASCIESIEPAIHPEGMLINSVHSPAKLARKISSTGLWHRKILMLRASLYDLSTPNDSRLFQK